MSRSWTLFAPCLSARWYPPGGFLSDKSDKNRTHISDVLLTQIQPLLESIHRWTLIFTRVVIYSKNFDQGGYISVRGGIFFWLNQQIIIGQCIKWPGNWYFVFKFWSLFKKNLKISSGWSFDIFYLPRHCDKTGNPTPLWSPNILQTKYNAIIRVKIICIWCVACVFVF